MLLFTYFRWSWSCYFGIGLGLITLVLVLRIWSCLHHWQLHATELGRYRLNVWLCWKRDVEWLNGTQAMAAKTGWRRTQRRRLPRVSRWGVRPRQTCSAGQVCNIISCLIRRRWFNTLFYANTSRLANLRWRIRLYTRRLCQQPVKQIEDRGNFDRHIPDVGTSGRASLSELYFHRIQWKVSARLASDCHTRINSCFVAFRTTLSNYTLQY